MKAPMFPCKYHQKGGFSMAMLVLRRVNRMFVCPFFSARLNWKDSRKSKSKVLCDFWIWRKTDMSDMTDSPLQIPMGLEDEISLEIS